MSNFSDSIQEFQAGDCTELVLIERLDDTLSNHNVNPTSLLTELTQEHTQRPLSDEVFASLVSRINTHLQNTTGHLGSQDDQSAETVRATETAISMAPKPDVGDTVNNRFVLDQLLGQGGMSRVYLATDQRKLEANSRDPLVAVKILDVGAANQVHAFVALQREAQKSQTLQHPNIMTVFDFDRDDNTVYLTMEYIKGQPLSKLIRDNGKQALPIDRVMSLVQQMGNALAHAHAKRIVHADFKPGNVMLTENDTIKVIDFGIARAYQLPDDVDDDATLFDPASLGALTPAYASPEMFEKSEATPKYDIYALGCVAYELLTGEHPFEHKQAPVAQSKGQRAAKPPGLNPTQWQALQGALEFDPDQRTDSVQAFLQGFLPAPADAKKTNSTLKSLVMVTGIAIVAGLAIWWNLQQQRNTSISNPLTSGQEGRFTDCRHCPKMMTLPLGSTRIGTPPTEADRREFEGPTFTVNITEPIAVGEAEVTVAEFRAYVEATKPHLDGCRTAADDWQPNAQLDWDNPGFPQSERHPVTCVSWQDTQGYITWLTKETGFNYRLPSEAEWEYAARADSAASTQWTDSSKACRFANVADVSATNSYPSLQTFSCNDGFVHTAPVRSGAANAFKLFDLQGNVFEWTQDCWRPNYNGADQSGAAWEAANCATRVLRGGSYFSAPSEQRLGYRNRFDSNYRANTFGFRVVRDMQ